MLSFINEVICIIDILKRREGTMLYKKLSSILADKKASILKKWLDVIIESYAHDASNYGKAQGNKFTNPIGSTLSKGIEDIFAELLRGLDRKKTAEVLADVVRLRAVQDFLPSEALSFFFSLKTIIRKELSAEIAEQQLSDEMLSLESSIDSFALSAFDMFMQCREKIYEIKANEVHRANFRLLQRANLIHASCGHKPAPEGNNLTVKEER
jgi:hypothetical protein